MLENRLENTGISFSNLDGDPVIVDLTSLEIISIVKMVKSKW